MDYKRCCLTCLGTNRDMRHFQSTVTIGGKDVRLNDILDTFYSYKVPQIHQHPEQLCITCVHHLTITYSFKILIENSARKLSEQMYDMKSPGDGIDQDDDSDEDVKSIELIPKQQQTNPRAVETTLKLGVNKAKKPKCLYCVECKVPFHSVSSLKRHCSENHPVKNAVGRACECCFEKFDNLRSALLHRKKHYKPYICEDCWDGFDTNEEITSHKCVQPDKQGKDECTYCCRECPKKFKVLKGLHLHEQWAHKRMKNYQCGFCHASFKNPSARSAHMTIIHKTHKISKPDQSAKDGLKQCDQCGKSYKSGYIRIHMLTHKDERTYSCKQCPKKFKVLGGLHSHIQCAHKRIKSHRCEFCNTMFISSSKKCAHVRKIHLNEKKHVCKCGKAFFWKTDLERHMLTHTGVKNYHCHVCDKAYQTRYALIVHLKSHSQINKAPAKCESDSRTEVSVPA